MRPAAALGTKRLDELTRGEIRRLQGHLMQSGRALMTVHNALIALRAMLRWTRELEYPDHDPLLRMRVDGVSKARRRWCPTAEEVHVLITALPERDRAMGDGVLCGPAPRGADGAALGGQSIWTARGCMCGAPTTRRTR